MSGDMQQHYSQLGYRIAPDGAVEFYYVVFRTDVRTGRREICLDGGFSWSNHFHDPSLSIQALPDHDGGYRYSRLGPYPNRAMAESKAIESALQMFSDPTRFGIFGTGGLHEIHAPEYRDPRFR